jgi:hypothetical protein
MSSLPLNVSSYIVRAEIKIRKVSRQTCEELESTMNAESESLMFPAAFLIMKNKFDKVSLVLLTNLSCCIHKIKHIASHEKIVVPVHLECRIESTHGSVIRIQPDLILAITS